MNRIHKITSVIIILIIAIGALSLIFLPKRDFSENENRYLASFPKASADSVLSGEFMEGIEEYTADHFPLRDSLAGLSTRAIKAVGIREKEGIYFIEGRDCQPDYLIEGYSDPVNTDRLAGIFRGFGDALEEKQVEAPLHIMLVPTAVSVLVDELPENAPDRGLDGKATQGGTMKALFEGSGLPAIDPGPILWQHKDEYIFYREDHHWTTLGAYYGYEAICEALQLSPVPWDEWDKKVVSRDFHGTLYSKSGDYSLMGDEIVSLSFPGDEITAYYEDINETKDGVYEDEWLSKKDKYAYFLNGIHPFIEITNESAATPRELVLIKDSYANSVVPYLAHHFRKIYVFDTRYYRQPVSDFAAFRQGVTDILVLYNMNTLDADQGARSIR